MIQKVLYQLKNLSEEVTYNVTTVTHKYLENTFWQKAYPRTLETEALTLE